MTKPSSGGWDEGGFPRDDKAGSGGGKPFGGGWGFESDWGYAGTGEKGASGGFDKNWGWDDKDQMAVDERENDGCEESREGGPEESALQHTVGTMLRHLGIDPETLGWDEDEGDFVGDP